ncbi:MAG TPA: hypothetical protein VMR23_06615, partial [Candidatus Limnocylindria bacterium]|nr:hypothetical protein [Candidatus Limnocylindria bacterium]
MRISRVSSVGVTAQSALARAGGVARVYAPLASCLYMTAGDAIIWLGADGPAHARAVLCAGIPDDLGVPGATVVLDVGRLAPWRPPPGPLTPGQAA